MGLLLRGRRDMETEILRERGREGQGEMEIGIGTKTEMEIETETETETDRGSLRGEMEWGGGAWVGGYSTLTAAETLTRRRQMMQLSLRRE